MFVLVGLGVVAGLLSGFLGIGGGTIIVPVLVAIGFTHRRAAATSLAAIVPTSIVGVIAYLISGEVDVVAALILAAGSITGAQVGAHLLVRMSERFLRWAFVVFLCIMAVLEFVQTPHRDTDLHYSVLMVVGLVALGLVTGFLASLLGVGGGIVVVPSMTAFFHASDITTRGTSLLMMIPTTLSGTQRNRRNGLVDFRRAAMIGVPAAGFTFVGKWLLGMSSPKLAAMIFGFYIVALIIRSFIVALRYEEPEPAPAQS